MTKRLEGLEDVVAAETVLSDVDGAAGRLLIRGWPVEDLVRQGGFEAAVRLLWDGFFPGLPDDLTAAIGLARESVFEITAPALADAACLPAVEALRAVMTRLGDGDDLAVGLRMAAAPGVLVPALARVRAGQAPVRPDAALSHAADVMRMKTGSPVSAALSAALDAYLTTVIDHGLNASTFTARVVASTQAGLGSAVVAGLSALKGPLHGGAPGPVLAMLDAIEARGDARAWLEEALDRGERLMGFGHRVYRVRDPRAEVLAGAVRRLCDAQAARGGRLELAAAVEAAAVAILAERKPDRPLQANVELYTALLLEALGFEADDFTGVFAMGRAAGWIAHAREQIALGRLVRPQSRYVGPRPPLAA